MFNKDLELVKQDGLNLRYIKNQTQEICIAAVQENEFALLYVIGEENEKACLNILKKNGNDLLHIKNQIHKICSASTRQNKMAIKYIKSQIDEIYLKLFG